MTEADGRDDWATLAAAGLAAMCVVTVDHEALGHGGMCLLLGGRVTLLSSSLFRCDVASPLIDIAGPASNFTLGALALFVAAVLPRGFPLPRLFFLLVGVFAWFWEGGYLVQAMATGKGDAYFAAREVFGSAFGPTARLFGAVIGVSIYIAALRAAAGGLLSLRPDGKAARAMGRTAWLAAALGAALAASLYRGDGHRDLHDAVLETAVASAPLLIIPARSIEGRAAPAIRRSPAMIGLAVLGFAAFAALLGRGLGSF